MIEIGVAAGILIIVYGLRIAPRVGRAIRRRRFRRVIAAWRAKVKRAQERGDELPPVPALFGGPGRDLIGHH